MSADLEKAQAAYEALQNKMAAMMDELDKLRAQAANAAKMAGKIAGLEKGIKETWLLIVKARYEAKDLREKGFNENLPSVYQVHALEPYVQVHMDQITHKWDGLYHGLDAKYRDHFGSYIDIDGILRSVDEHPHEKNPTWFKKNTTFGTKDFAIKGRYG